ncbi:MAG: amylo-alpha-1,6-glucosidase, partial [Alicyclobacillus sp.]|nr:amylo-alpha-1,6-glucosidase [Alicyclobacillus sp.]
MNYRVIKEDDLFLVSAPGGQVPSPEDDPFGYGLYQADTRVLSRLVWRTSPDVWVPLDGTDEGNFRAVYLYTNREWRGDDAAGPAIPRESLFVTRTQMVDGKRLYERVDVQNFGPRPVSFDVVYEVAADFLDMFEVRGFSGGERGSPAAVEALGDELRFSYAGSDGVLRQTTVCLAGGSGFTGLPAEAHTGGGAAGRLRGRVTVEGQGKAGWMLVVEPEHGREPGGAQASGAAGAGKSAVAGAADAGPKMAGAPETGGMMPEVGGLRCGHEAWFADWHTAEAAVASDYRRWLETAPVVRGHDLFARWYRRGLLDVRMLLTDIGYGRFPVAGVPWFAVPFGRDSLITALMLLPVQPAVAAGTLRTMAAFQGRRVDRDRDEEPGKIMHELRAGELTRAGRVPFGPYYGTVDATPLFLNLAADYYLWTGDIETVRELVPHADRAFEWLERFGDRDGDGFVEYFRETAGGLANQGWKDSGDSVVHKDGTLAEGPIALCEVQGYAYEAALAGARLLDGFGESGGAELREWAAHLKRRFAESYWVETPEGRYPAVALDAHK